MGRWLEAAAMLLVAVWWTALCQDVHQQRSPRQKRILWITTDGRLALPPGTLLTITPTISMPFVRYPPDGFLSNMTISLPFTRVRESGCECFTPDFLALNRQILVCHALNFDMLGLTDNQNPYGALPPLLARGLGRSAGSFFADYLASLISSRRHSRASKLLSDFPTQARKFVHGGERGLLYILVEDFLSNFGMDGKACLLRAICEVNGHSLKNYGFLGEILKLFFTASKSPYSEVLNDYVTAERQGLERGECFPYYKDCPKSLFASSEKNKYLVQEAEHEDNFLENEVEYQKGNADDSLDQVAM